jgi:hypothetical protein
MRSKVYTITINGKEEFLCGNIESIVLRSHKSGLDYRYHVDEQGIRDAVPGLFTPSPKWSEIVKDAPALTMNLAVIAREFGIKGRWKNTSGYGHTTAKHKTTATDFHVFTDRVSD